MNRQRRTHRAHTRRRTNRNAHIMQFALIGVICFIAFVNAVQSHTVRTVTIYSPYGLETWSYTGDFDVKQNGDNVVIQYREHDGSRHTVNSLGAVYEITERRIRA